MILACSSGEVESTAWDTDLDIPQVCCEVNVDVAVKDDELVGQDEPQELSSGEEPPGCRAMVVELPE